VFTSCEAQFQSVAILVCVIVSLFVWLVADGWCWFVLREKYCWLVADGWLVLREKYSWLVAGKPNEQGVCCVVFVIMHLLSVRFVDLIVLIVLPGLANLFAGCL
jgi:hypothetical protein